MRDWLGWRTLYRERESKLKVSIEFLPQSKEDPEEEGAIDSKSQDEGHQERTLSPWAGSIYAQRD